MKDSIPKLTRVRSTAAWCATASPVSPENAASKRKAFKETEIGNVHVDSYQLRSAEGKVHLFLAIDRVSKFAYAEFSGLRAAPPPAQAGGASIVAHAVTQRFGSFTAIGDVSFVISGGEFVNLIGPSGCDKRY